MSPPLVRLSDVRVAYDGVRVLHGVADLDEEVEPLLGVEPQDERAMTHSPADLILLLDESAGHGGIEMGENRQDADFLS